MHRIGPAPPRRRYLSVVASMFQRLAKLSSPEEGEGRGEETMAKAPPLLPCIMNRVPGFSIFRNFFFPPLSRDLIQREAFEREVNFFRNEKLSSLSIYAKRTEIRFGFVLFLCIQISHGNGNKRRKGNIFTAYVYRIKEYYGFLE